MSFKYAKIAMFAGAMFAVAPASAQVTVSGPTASTSLLAGGEAGGVRYRELACRNNGGGSCNDAEVLLGSNLGGLPNTTYNQQNLGYLAGANSFTFSYSAATDTLTSILNGNTSNRTGFIAGLSAAVQAQDFDTLSILIADREVGGLISLSDLSLNGNAFGPLTGVDNGGLQFWSVTGANFKQDFSLTGNLNLSGAFGASAELNRVEFLIGNGPITAAVPEPATWAMMLSGFGVMGGALRTRRSRRAKVALA